MDDIKNCFRDLDIKPTSNIDDVKQAYRDQAKVWHPDRFQGDERLQQKAQEKIKEVNVAYEKILKHLKNPKSINDPISSHIDHGSSSQGVMCSHCQRCVTPQLWHYAQSRFHHLKTQHLCPFCGVVLYETGGGVKREAKFAGYALFLIPILLVIVQIVSLFRH